MPCSGPADYRKASFFCQRMEQVGSICQVICAVVRSILPNVAHGLLLLCQDLRNDFVMTTERLSMKYESEHS